MNGIKILLSFIATLLLMMVDSGVPIKCSLEDSILYIIVFVGFSIVSILCDK